MNLRTSIQVAIEAHKGVNRKYTGRPYIEHPARVAAKCAIYFVNHNMFEYIVGAAWLHDVVEDNPNYTFDWFKDNGFHEYQINLMKELTNPSKGSKLKRAARKHLDREHLSQVSSVSKIIKLVDRYDNINELNGSDADFKKLYYDETRLLVDTIGNCDKISAYDTMSREQLQSILDSIKQDIYEFIL